MFLQDQHSVVQDYTDFREDFEKFGLVRIPDLQPVRLEFFISASVLSCILP